ncbi:MAG TPA: helix-hairpin-helix domain-containing protein, partial [Gammaproteobacteria bacterium]|nr:helix-hairpin-helix domain-containing protein [Gammaproteobacteria bacterium]
AAAVFSSSLFAAPVNINKASAEQIADALKGIGMAKATAIVEYRKKNGKFKKPEDIVKVKGVGPAIFAKIKKDVKVK